MLCFQNEYSDVVWFATRLYYKILAESKVAAHQRNDAGEG
jgi:hypothetical protein